MKTNKEHFIEYLEKYGNDAEPFYFSKEETPILSFAGSDGPDIMDAGIGDEDEFTPYENTKEIDEIINDGCSDNYFTNKEGHKPVLPSMTWDEYYNKYVNQKQ